jgi:hypothetical protein
MSQQVKTTLDFNLEGKIINLLDGVNPQDPATVAQLNAAIEGLSPKDSARVATVSNISIASPGATIDGIAMAAGDRVIVKNQTTASENGIYVWTGAATAMTRSLDANTANELEAAIVAVEEGTVNAATTWRQTTVNFVLNTGNVAWVQFGVAASPASETTAGIAQVATQAEVDAGVIDTDMVTPLKLKSSTLIAKMASGLIGDGTATQYDIVHNFNSRKVEVVVRRNSSPWDRVQTDDECPDVNTVRIRFNVAPTANAYEVTIIAKP